MVERLRRLDWYFERAPVYFVTTCTHQRRVILADARLRERLMQFAELGMQRGIWMGAFVLMPDHLHAFVAFGEEGEDEGTGGSRKPAEEQLGRWVKSLKNALSKVLREAGVEAPHWQKGYFDHVLRSEESYAEKWEYVLQNPVRAGLVARAEDWPYWGQPYPLECRSGE